MKLVLMVLAEQARHGQCWPSQASLAADCELSDRAVRKALAALEEAGFIRREPRHAKGGRSDLITLQLGHVEMDIPRNAVPGSERHGVPVTPERGADEPIKNQSSPLTPQVPVTTGRAASPPPLVWVDVDTPQFEAWALRWEAERPGRGRPWVSQHHQDRSREGRWVPSEWPPSDDPSDIDA